MPAEWERHHATWIGWPHNTNDWPGRFGPIPWAYAEIVRKLARGEVGLILVTSHVHERAARRALTSAGVSPDRAEFFRFPTNRGWTRDFGPLFVRRSGPSAELAIARFRFNAWAKYPDWKKDDRIPERVAGPATGPATSDRCSCAGPARQPSWRSRGFVSTRGPNTPTGRRTTASRNAWPRGSSCRCFPRAPGEGGATWCSRAGAST